MSEYSKYTYTLQEVPDVLTQMGLPPLFTVGYDEYDEPIHFDYSLITNDYPDFNSDFLEELWFRHYRYREIGAETMTRWLNYLYDTWHELCYKYHNLFKLFEQDYQYAVDSGLIDNNDLSVVRNILFQDTPQSAIPSSPDDITYATNKTKESTSLAGRTLTKPKYELLSEYAKRERHIYDEWVKDTEVLFMQVL